jgi:hydroxyacylglutathione hydrolase
MTNIKTFTFNPFQENTYILYDENLDAVIIDPGCYTAEERNIVVKFVEDKQLKIKRLLNTHCHLDHIFGNIFIMEKYQVDLECHRLELPNLQRAHIAGDMFGVPIPPQPTPSVWIEENDIIEVGTMQFKTLLSPGHSPGSLCFYNEKEQFLIGGDVLFYGSIGRSDLPGGNHNQLINSILEKLMTLPDEVKVYSGHGPTTMIGYERYNNPFLQ